MPARRSAIQFSLKSAILLIAVASLGFAALRDSTEAWAAAVSTVTLMATFAAILAAAFGSRECAPSRGGFAICCGVYLLLMNFSAPELFDNLATSKSSMALMEEVHPAADPFVTGVSGKGIVEGGHDDDFMVIAHYLWAILLGAIGAVIAAYASSLSADDELTDAPSR